MKPVKLDEFGNIKNMILCNNQDIVRYMMTVKFKKNGKPYKKYQPEVERLIAENKVRIFDMLPEQKCK